MNWGWLLISGVVLLPLVYLFIDKKINKKDTSEKRLQVQRKETLDAILKNNKDRYLG